MTTARWNGQTIAVSDATTIVEGNHYFSPQSVRLDLLTPSETHTECPWKGTASYYTITVDGKQNADAAWYYPEPKPDAEHIRGYIAFWRGVEIMD